MNLILLPARHRLSLRQLLGSEETVTSKPPAASARRGGGSLSFTWTRKIKSPFLLRKTQDGAFLQILVTVSQCLGHTLFFLQTGHWLGLVSG